MPEVVNKTKDAIKSTMKFWTMDSKKLVLTIIFVISVIIDKVLLNDKIYGQDIYTAKVFQSYCIAIVIIVTKDIQDIVHKFIGK